MPWCTDLPTHAPIGRLAERHVRRVPVLTRQCEEAATVFGDNPLLAERRVDGLAGGQVDGESEQHRIPAHSHGAGAELVPVVVDMDDVLDHQSRPVRAFAADGDIDPADVAAELPGGREVLRRVAGQTVPPAWPSNW